jgi:hypothetical protein
MELNNNFIYIEKNFFSEEDCKNIINQFNIDLIKGSDHSGYIYKNILFDNFISDKNFLNKFNNNLTQSINEYKLLYPEINQTTSIWGLTDLRFKKFNIGKCFSGFHSEHSLSYPNRVLSIQLYLSTHDCGTEFYRDNFTIKSEIGKLAIFPAYFTHTHRGQVCKENKERFIITGYISFVKKGLKE